MTSHLRFGLLATLLLAAASGILGWQVYSNHDPASPTTLDEARRLLESITNRPEVLTGTPLRRALSGRGANLTVSGILSETNRHRAAAGLPPLTLNSTLSRAADTKVADMFTLQYFEHEAPDGTGPAELVTTTGYDFIRVGENLALGNFASDADLVQAWMDSPGHRANILHVGYTEIGLSASSGTYEDNNAWLAVQEFALPLSACPGVDNTLRSTIDQQRAALDTSSASFETILTQLNQEQEALSALAQEINQLREQGAAKITEGNRSIEEGNRVYEETNDRDQAEPYWTRGEQQQAEGRALLDQAEQKQAEYQTRRDAFETKRAQYNTQVTSQQRTHTELKRLIERLNQQINAFNTCLKSTSAS